MKKPKKLLSLFDSTSIIVSSIVGAGIFEAAPIVAASCSTWQTLLLLWFLGGMLSFFGALVYAELTTKYPNEGGDYIFLSKAFGKPIGFLFAWAQITIIQPGSIAAMSFLFASYFSSLLKSLSFQLIIPKSIIAALVIIFTIIINSLSIKLSIKFQNVLTILSVFGLLLIISLIFISPINHLNIPFEQTKPLASIELAMILILFAYGGWNQVAFVAGEVEKPKRNLALSLCFGVFIVTLLYCLTNLSFLYILGHTKMAYSNSVASDAIASVFPNYSSILISLLICIATLGSIQAMFFSGARVNYALGKDYSIFSKFYAWNNSSQTPQKAYLFQGAMTLFIILFTGSFTNSIIYTSAIVWTFFFLTGLSLFLLKQEHISNTFNARPYPLVPFMFCLSSLYLTYSCLNYDLKGSITSFIIVGLGYMPYRFSKIPNFNA